MYSARGWNGNSRASRRSTRLGRSLWTGSTRLRVYRVITLATLSFAAHAGATVIETQNIEYARVAGEVLLLDLYRPDGTAKAPLLAYVHGGAWENGGKEPMPLTDLVEHGYAIASLDFRPASRARFPGQVHDIKAAIRYLRATAERHGYYTTRWAPRRERILRPSYRHLKR